MIATFYFVRHAKAGSRTDWEGDDRKRPLSKKGLEQAGRLVKTLEPVPIAHVLSSPYLRCIETVAPLALARGFRVIETTALAEGAGLRGAYRFLDDANLDEAVLCTHGDVLLELVEDLVRKRVLPGPTDQIDKGSTWVVQAENGKPVQARYIPAP